MCDYIHPLPPRGESLPEAFTFPFRYTAHPLCRRAAAEVERQVAALGISEGKMYGVLVAKRADEDTLCFLAAYSGQFGGSYDYPWFVPPVVDYLTPGSHFLTEQDAIVGLGCQAEALRTSPERREAEALFTSLRADQWAAITAAREAYARGKAERERRRQEGGGRLSKDERQALILQSQTQKADIRRARQLHAEAIDAARARLRSIDDEVQRLLTERRQRSEALQQWLFSRFVMLNGRGERRALPEIWEAMGGKRYTYAGESNIPSGTGECCAPKLLQAAYAEGLRPVAMAEFWLGAPTADGSRRAGVFYPACSRKCRPLLRYMLQGVSVEADPAARYDVVAKPLRVVWEDAWMAVIEKPEGWLSIPGIDEPEGSAFAGTHLPDVAAEVRRLWPDGEASIVHRLDQDTSGLMLVAKRRELRREFTQMFERREIHKTYVALLDAAANPALSVGAKGEVCLPLSPDRAYLPLQRVDHEHGAAALTRYEVLHREGDLVRIAFFPVTGRTHQLRLHAASPEGLAAPIHGDRLYGTMADRMCLHAAALELAHPVTHEPLHIVSECPF